MQLQRSLELLQYNKMDYLNIAHINYYSPQSQICIQNTLILNIYRSTSQLHKIRYYPEIIPYKQYQ